MISPDILKQSATAGFAGFAVATTVFGVALTTTGPTEARVDMSEWTDPVRVSFEEAEEVTGRVERRADTASDAPETPRAKQAAIEARNRAARRALEKLQSIECNTVDAAEHRADRVRIHINHAAVEAARDVVVQP